jgi:hypothetical protein
MEMTKEKKGFPTLLLVIAVLVFVFVFPRILIAWLGPGSPWTSYLYQYGLGSVTFLIGISLIKRTGAYKKGRGHDDFWFKWLIAGFFIFAVLHAVWILLAVSIPVKGGV